MWWLNVISSILFSVVSSSLQPRCHCYKFRLGKRRMSIVVIGLFCGYQHSCYSIKPENLPGICWSSPWWFSPCWPLSSLLDLTSTTYLFTLPHRFAPLHSSRKSYLISFYFFNMAHVLIWLLFMFVIVIIIFLYVCFHLGLCVVCWWHLFYASVLI